MVLWEGVCNFKFQILPMKLFPNRKFPSKTRM